MTCLKAWIIILSAYCKWTQFCTIMNSVEWNMVIWFTSCSDVEEAVSKTLIFNLIFIVSSFTCEIHPPQQHTSWSHYTWWFKSGKGEGECILRKFSLRFWNLHQLKTTALSLISLAGLHQHQITLWRRQWHPLQYSCLENLMDGGGSWAAVHGVTKGWTRLSDFTFTFHFHALEKERATHSSVLAWRIPESLVGCCLWGRIGSDTTETT